MKTKSTPTPTRRQALALFSTLFGTGLLAGQAYAHGEESINIQTIFEKELAGHEGEQVSMTVVSYGPGKSSPAHRHHGPVFVYVLEGEVELQIAGGPLTKVKAGETFYEPPGSIHEVSRNASQTKPCKLLAFIIGKQGTAITSPLSH